MKSDATFKRAFNDAVELVERIEEGAPLPSEPQLCAALKVSRTTVRKVIAALSEPGLVVGTGRDRRRALGKPPVRKFPQAETVSISTQVEIQFMEWMLRDNARPGTAINELELARRFGVATTVVREFLNRFQRFGLIEKSPGSGWAFKGFTTRFACELFEIREMFELRSALLFVSLNEESPLWVHLSDLRRRHVDLLDDIDARYRDFPELDSAFHRLLNSVSPNRFIDNFYDIITMVFHYHYQWNKRDERQRNEVAAREHLAYMDALISRDPAAAQSACQIHLSSARDTLLKSTMRQSGF
ncbi:MAG: GntR family transcriptional regulator [Cereibacter sphaeroides]|uniref:GntR family transcriptional regulator n=1 Tax=Cereibacter sphaeroides TaxID=1063 RepID=A0A2W5RXR3_CERSP|nr:MAG: GntR family transcriptional regulator [Cereibacter sphaeroides]